MGSWGYRDLSADFLALLQFTPAVIIPGRMVALTLVQKTQAHSCANHCISHPKCKANQAEVEKSYLAVVSLLKQLSKASQLISVELVSKSSSNHHILNMDES